MAVFVVTWDLNRENLNYPLARAAFVKQFESYDNIKDDGLDSVRFISTSSTAVQVDSFLRQKLDANDRLFVSKLAQGGHQGWLNPAVWEWINARL